MRPNTRPILAALLAIAVTAAVAQTAPNGGASSQQSKGFFSTQTQSDPSLFRTLPPEAYEATTPAGQAAPAQPAATPPTRTDQPLVVVVPEAANPEAQLDRAQLEAQQAQANRAPAPINGAFTGLTDPRNR